MDRKDGSIVNKIQLQSGDLVTNPDEVAKVLIEELKNLQTTIKEPSYNSPISFPDLSLLSKEENKEIIRNISVNKAIAFDGISDVIFNNDNIDKSSKILSDLWNVNWNKIPEANLFFKSRLVP